MFKNIRLVSILVIVSLLLCFQKPIDSIALDGALSDNFDRQNGPVGESWHSWWGYSLDDSTNIFIKDKELRTAGYPQEGGGLYQELPVFFPVKFSFDFRTLNTSNECGETPFNDGGWRITLNAAQSDTPMDSVAQVKFEQYAGSRNIIRRYIKNASATDQSGMAEDVAPGISEPIPGQRDFTDKPSHIEGTVNQDLSAQFTIHYNDGLSPDPVIINFAAAPGALNLQPGKTLMLSNSNCSPGPHFFDNFEIGPLVINQPPFANAGEDQTVFEGDIVTLDGSLSNDPDGDALAYQWDIDNDNQFDDATGPVAKTTFADDGFHTIGLLVTDSNGASSTDTIAITVLNSAPIVDAITAPAEPVTVSTLIHTSVNFNDRGVLDSHIAVWDWGDNQTSSGIVNENNGSGLILGSHVYNTPGVYVVTVTVTDKDGGTGISYFKSLVIYDPSGPSVNGGGWINSPSGAFTPDPNLDGKASLNFNLNYPKNAQVPNGSANFQFHAAHIDFSGQSYEWLVIVENKAQFQGSGTINNMGDYGFMVTIIANDQQKFRIKIWDKSNGNIVYDNMPGAADNSDPITLVEGGLVNIHKTK